MSSSTSPPRLQAVEQSLAPTGQRVAVNSRFLRSLEAFLAVERHRSFSKAARALSLAQPTITLRIRGLERALGVQLFERDSRGVDLTETGRNALTYAERLLALRDEMLAEIRGVAAIRQGILRLAASSTPGNYVLPLVLQRFRERFPGLCVDIDIGDSARVLDQMLAGEAEIGVIGFAVNDDRLVCEPFLQDEIVVVAPPGHPVLARNSVAPAELTRHPWVVREAGSATRKIAEEKLARLTRRRATIAMVVNSTEAIKRAVRAGQGIALVSRRSADHEIADGTLGARPLSGAGLRRQFHLLARHGRTLSPAAAALWSHLLGQGRLDGRLPEAGGKAV